MDVQDESFNNRTLTLSTAFVNNEIITLIADLKRTFSNNLDKKVTFSLITTDNIILPIFEKSTIRSIALNYRSL